MRLLHAGVDTTVIALWLSHESVTTTQIYLHADLALKERALARTAPITATPDRYRAHRHDHGVSSTTCDAADRNPRTGSTYDYPGTIGNGLIHSYLGAIMRVLFTGEPRVHYGQVYVKSGYGLSGDLEASFAGPRNGLCGAAVPRTLFLITGLHLGKVGFCVERHDAPPAVGPEWEEIVEASFRPVSPRVWLCQWSGEWWDLDLPERDYRVRYCASGMDSGRAADTRMDGEPQLDRYLLRRILQRRQRSARMGNLLSLRRGVRAASPGPLTGKGSAEGQRPGTAHPATAAARPATAKPVAGQGVRWASSPAWRCTRAHSVGNGLRWNRCLVRQDRRRCGFFRIFLWW